MIARVHTRAGSRAVAGAVALAVWAAGGIAVAGGGGVGAPGPGQPPVAGIGGGVTPGFGSTGYRFPLDAPHTYGDGFGAGRGHEGQDVFARCGAPVLAARSGRIQRVDYHHRAGHYLVVDGIGTGVDTMYAHLIRRPTLRRGETVTSGERIARVGSSGNASGCHLHFEIWTAPGWYEGGFPMATVGRLMRSWDTRS